MCRRGTKNDGTVHGNAVAIFDLAWDLLTFRSILTLPSSWLGKSNTVVDAEGSKNATRVMARLKRPRAIARLSASIISPTVFVISAVVVIVPVSKWRRVIRVILIGRVGVPTTGD